MSNKEDLFIPPTTLPEPSEQERDTFKFQITSWVKLDKKIKELTNVLKEQKTLQKALSVPIQEFMSKFGYYNINTEGGLVKNSVRTAKPKPKAKEVKGRVLDLYGPEAVKSVFSTDGEPIVRKSLRLITQQVTQI